MIVRLRRVVFAILMVHAGGANAETFLLEAEIKNAVAGTGVIRAELHDTAETYLSRDDVPAFRSIVVPVVGGRVVLLFNPVPPGRYAISLYQDLNNNAELDSNFLRIPKEPYGFSNNFRTGFGPPSFEQAAFEVKANLRIEVELR